MTKADTTEKRHRWWHGAQEVLGPNGPEGVYCFRCGRWLRYDDDKRRMV